MTVGFYDIRMMKLCCDIVILAYIYSVVTA